MARRPCSAPAKGRPKAQSEADRKLQLIAGLHSQKVADLLNSQNRLQCENAQLRKQELEYRQSSKRAPAFVRAETELSRQDAMISELSKLCPDTARSVARAALIAGPRRVQVTTRLELKWDIEDECVKLDSVRKKTQALVDEHREAELIGSKREDPYNLIHLKERLAELKREAANLSMANQAHQVEHTSLERVLQRGAELFVRLREQQPTPAGACYGGSILAKRLMDTQEEILQLQRKRTDLEKTILQTNLDLKQKEAANDSKAREIEKYHHKAIEAKKQAEVVAQSRLLREQKKVAEKMKDLQGAQGRLKATLGEKKIGMRDREQRRAVSIGDSARREFTLRRDFQAEWKKEEEDMQNESDEMRKYLKHAEGRLELDHEECLKEYRQHQSVEHELAQEHKQQKSVLDSLEVEQRQEEQKLAQVTEAVQAAKAQKEERMYLEDELESLHRSLNLERQRHATHDEELAVELKALQQSLQTKVNTVYPLRVADKTFADNLKAEVCAAQHSAAAKVAKVRQDVELQRDEYRVQEEAVSMRRAAKEERAEVQQLWSNAAAMVQRRNAQQQLLLTAQREREAAARDLRKAKLQIERWILDQSIRKQPADAEWDRASVIAELERERIVDGKDIAVVRAQIKRWNALHSQSPAEQLPDLADEVPHEHDQSFSTPTPWPMDVPVTAEQPTDLQEAIRTIEFELAQLAEERRLLERYEEAPQTLTDDDDELNFMLSRAAELEDACLELEQKHAALEHQVRAAQVLIRKLQNRIKETTIKGCQRCDYGRDVYRKSATTQ